MKERRPKTSKRLLLLLAVAAYMSFAAYPLIAKASDWVTGDVFAGLANGSYNVYDNSGVFKENIDQGLGGGFATGCAFEPTQDPNPQNLWTTNFGNSTIVEFAEAHPHAILQSFASGGTSSESIVFAANGDFYVGHADGDADVRRYDATGAFQQQYDVATEARGSDHIELAADQTTLFYTSEGGRILRYDLSTGTQLPDFASIGGNSFALRLLPPGDGSTGLLVANFGDIKRLDASGAVIQTYDAPGEDSWFALNLDPNGTSFWSADIFTGSIYRFNIATGAIEVGPIEPNASVVGLCVKGERTSSDADLSITKTDSPDPVAVGATLTYTVTVTNEGPVETATEVTVEDVLPAGVTFQSATPSQGTCTQAAGTVTCNLGDLARDASATVQITVTPQSPGTITNTATVTGGQRDPEINNNTATESTTVQPGQPTGAGCKVTVGGQITAANGDKANFGGNAQPGTPPKGQLQYTDHGPVSPLKVHSLSVLSITCSADRKQATITGKATVNGQGSFDYRIDVKDLGEPGRNDTYRIRLSNGYDSGEQQLKGGNIQIHKK
jgi:uncharacterized repeat protein (TIGR01451 family)